MKTEDKNIEEQTNSIAKKYMDLNNLSCKDKKWLSQVKKLLMSKRKNGDCNVLNNDMSLRQWTSDQRMIYKKGKIPEARFKILTEIGFQWKDLKNYLYQLKWDEQFKLLCKFKEKNGHCNVFYAYQTNNKKLGLWVVNQRYLYKKLLNGAERGNLLTKERQDKLNSIGFSWCLSSGKSHAKTA